MLNRSLGSWVLVTCIAGILASLCAVAPAHAAACTPEQIRNRTCSVETESEFNGGGVDLSAESNTDTGTTGDGNAESPAAPPPPPPPYELPIGAKPTTPGEPGYEQWQWEQCQILPVMCDEDLVVTLADIASFKATPPVLAQMQPSGWALKGLPMNAVATASVEEVSGDLLGYPASVRFTPVGFAWNYGDGATRSSKTGGASWEALGLPELSATSTSHVYAARGQYAVTVSVLLVAEYRFAGQQWRPITGTLQIAGAPSAVTVKQINTVLVRGNCAKYPNDPGC